MVLHVLAQYYNYESARGHDLQMMSVVVGGVVVIVISILLYRLISGAAQRQHQLKELEIKVRRDTMMTELREQTACRCPRCGTQMELVRKESPAAALVAAK